MSRNPVEKRYLVVPLEENRMVDVIGVFKDLLAAKLCADNTPARTEILAVTVTVLSAD